jgi:hypothetical protein
MEGWKDEETGIKVLNPRIKSKEYWCSKLIGDYVTDGYLIN